MTQALNSIPQIITITMLAFITSRPVMSFSSNSQHRAIYSSQRILPLNRPPDPSSFNTNTTNNSNNTNTNNNDDDNNDDTESTNYITTQSIRLQNWLQSKQSILVLTGAGMSTESGIPDYRGANGSYFKGHKPIIHHEFLWVVNRVGRDIGRGV